MGNEKIWYGVRSVIYDPEYKSRNEMRLIWDRREEKPKDSFQE